MKYRHLPITTTVILTVTVILLVVFSPGYLEYQKMRWRTKLPPERIQAGMTGMLVMTKALEQVLGTRPLTTKDFDKFSADTLKEIQKMADYNDIAMLLRIGYLNRLLDDPSGTDLKQRLFEEIAKDVSDRIVDRSKLAEQMRISAYTLAVREPNFEKILLSRIGDLDRLGLSQDDVESIRAEQAGTGQSATNPADKPTVKEQPSTPTSKDAPR